MSRETRDVWTTARRVLCVRLDNLGDVLMSTPAMRALKRGLPDRHLTLWCSRAGAALAPYLPEIDDTLVHDAPWVSHPADAGVETDRAMIEALRQGAFDAAVIFTVYTQSPLPAAMMCRLAGIPRVLAHCRENAYRLITDRVDEIEPLNFPRHEVQRQLDLVATIGARTADTRLSFVVPETAHRQAAAALQRVGIDLRHPFVLLHPGASAASRRYPVTRFAAAVDRIRARLRCAVVLVAGAAEADLVAGIQSRLREPAPQLVAALDLGALAAAIGMATVFIGNNSGPAHLAAAVGTPVVDLYALTNPQHAPWQVSHRLLFQDVSCRWCYRSQCPQQHHLCLEGVEPQAVADAVVELWSAKQVPAATTAVAA